MNGYSHLWSAGYSAPPFARVPYGLGDAAEAQYAKLATSTAGSAVSGVAAFGILGPLAATGIGLALVGVGIALQLIFSRRGPQQKVETTAIVNQAEPVLRDNLNLYLSSPIRSKKMQAAALSNFDTTWAHVVALCNTPNEGDPGKRCTDDRDAGSCTWHDAAGACWNWFSGYRDPIANDAGVVDDATAAAMVSAAAAPVNSSAAPGSGAPASSSAGGAAGTADIFSSVSPAHWALLGLAGAGLAFLAFAFGGDE